MANTELQHLREALLNDTNGRLTATCRRLVRIAQARGIAPDVVDDVVQETLLEAWHHMDRLYAPEGFQAWIDEICRNISRRYMHRHAFELSRSMPVSGLESVSGSEPDFEEIYSPVTLSAGDASDPLEELCRQDMLALLDRALGFLPAQTRRLVEMCHLLELPHVEVAARLGISTGTLETRLHRARRQLRQLLNGPLHHEAEVFGLALDEGIAEGWQETRLWCPLCARHRLQGCFFEQEDGMGPNLHLRCPGCSQRYQRDTLHTMGLVSLEGLHSFRPAWKRAMQGISDLVLSALATGQQLPCLFCGKPASIQVMNRDAVFSSSSYPYTFWIRWHCNHCGEHIDSDGDIPSIDQLVYWSHPQTRQFVQQHQRWSSEPATLLEHNGQQALRFQLADVESADHTTVVAHRQTLQILAISL
jgi:RNA polymerase sigma-70 factor (ECF subfamily)